MSEKRRQYRYVVDLESAQLTPLASVRAYLGEEPLRVLNVSLGGLALLFERQKELQASEVLELSLEIRQRAFPVRVEVKASRGLRYSCQFLDLPPACEAALEAFMGPKAIGESLQLNEKLTNNPQALSLVPGTQSYLAYVGKDESVAFVWLRSGEFVKKLFLVSKGWVLEWTPELGLRTGDLDKQNPDEPKFHEQVNELYQQYFLDILTSWLSGDEAIAFAKELVAGGSQTVRFPKPPVASGD